TKHGRDKFIALLPRFRDIRDAISLVSYNLNFRKDRPKFPRYSYFEKAEYWALIWGSFVMIITGLVMMFENISLQYLPKWLIDVMLLIHFFEALLATLAILVWHFYWVIFDPEIYPMNWSWITGKHTSHQLGEREMENDKTKSPFN
ncbi:MAG: cytochrome b/b6 domain-containing protein, partial [Deltaproteobacteria bacterium]|nr:cytochrome b/b6 domain-containing protein [Deltaproteobacteria bacterium]